MTEQDPQFDTPTEKKGWRGKIIIALAIVAFFAFFNILGRLDRSSANKPATTTAPATQPKAQVQIDKSPAKQQGRKTIIDLLTAKGVFSKITQDPKQSVNVWVTPAFTSLPKDQQGTFASVIYCYYFDGKNRTDTVHFLDKTTNKEIGAYGMNYGGLKLK